MMEKMENRVLARNGARILSDEEVESVSGGCTTAFLTKMGTFNDVAENDDGQ